MSLNSESKCKGPSTISLLSTLHSSHIAIAGMNCVGESTAELLLRNGIRHLTLVDDRQIHYDNFLCNIPPAYREEGTYAIDQIHTYLKKLFPDAKIVAMKTSINDFIATGLKNRYDFIVDVSPVFQDKLSLISAALKDAVPVITCMDTGRRINPSEVQEGTIKKAANVSKMADAIQNYLLQQNEVVSHNQVTSQITHVNTQQENSHSQHWRSLSEQICNLPVIFSNEPPRNIADGQIIEQCLTCKCPPFVSLKCHKRRLSDTCNVYVTSMAAMLLTRHILSGLLQRK